MNGDVMDKQSDRLRRQFDTFARAAPPTRPLVDALLKGRLRLIRLPLAFLLIFGGFLAILPVFGFWMLPLGLMLLALDVPALQPVISSLLIRGRRWIQTMRRRFGRARQD